MNRLRIKRIGIALSVILVVGLLSGGMYLKSIRDYQEKMNAITFTDIDLKTVADGVYEGWCDTGVVRAGVLVTVREHAITEIELTRHDNGRRIPAEAILARMLQEQTTDVDAVSGATCSSKVIRKAVENALEKGVSEERVTEMSDDFAVTAEELAGPWHLAEGENDDAAIWDAFPGAMEFGSGMEIKSDGRISWYIGADGGTGTYTARGNLLHAELTTALDGSAMAMDLTAEKKDGKLRLIMEYQELDLCWVQGEGETGKGE